MHRIEHNATSYLVDGQPVYLNSGEFHYFRVPKHDWRRRMELLKEAGGNCLATYVPWVIHEPVEGGFVFGREDYTDLEGFLRTAQEAGLYVIARPGPYQYSELLYAGLPHWLCDRYPQILAQGIDGSILHPTSVSYLHPLFLAKSRRWFDEVCPLLARYTVGRGGPLAFAQVDNELAGIHLWHGGPDYHPDTMGFGRPDGRFTLFLRWRYGNIDALNEAYGMNESQFEDVFPAPMQGAPTAPELRWRKDYLDFYLATVAEYARMLAAWLRERGVDTPVVHNSPSPEANALFRETAAVMGRDFVLGSDHYYTLDQTWPQNNPTPQYARRVFASLEMLRLMDYPPTVFELPGGSLSDWPPVTPGDAEACYLTNLALGMKGHNYYIFTGGANPPGVGSTADIYDYGAGISAGGEVRPLYAAQQRFGQFVRDYPWLADAEREGDCRFAFDWEMPRAGYYWHERGDFLFSPPEAWRFLLEGPLSTAFCAGLSPVFCDLGRDDWTADTHTPVVIVTSSVMPAACQERIVRYLRSGGQVLFLPVLPELDERLGPCTRLREFLGWAGFRSGGNAPTRLTIAGVANVFNNGEVFYADPPPGGTAAAAGGATGIEAPGGDPAEAGPDAATGPAAAVGPSPVVGPVGATGVIGIDERTGLPVAWRRQTEGGGTAVVLGFRWRHAMREHERMLRDILAEMGVERKVVCSNPNVWTSLRTANDHSMLFLMNLLTSPQEAAVQCRPAWAAAAVDAGTNMLPPMTVKCVELVERGPDGS